MMSVICKKFQTVKNNGYIELFKSYKPDYKDGEQKRDFVYIKDTVEVMHYFFNNPKKTGIFNLEQNYRNLTNAKCHFIVANILDKTKLARVFKKHKPDVVFHAAAYKHVPIMEKDPCEAVRNNVLGTWFLARLALANKADKFVLISTDKAVKPSSIMGATKRVAEMLISYLNKKQQF